MKRTRPEDRECPLSTTLDVGGEWWAILLLHDLFDGYTQFDQFQKNLGISSGILTTRLTDLVDRGLIERRRYETRPTHYECVRTEKRRSLRPVIVALASWGNSRLRPSSGA